MVTKKGIFSHFRTQRSVRHVRLTPGARAVWPHESPWLPLVSTSSAGWPGHESGTKKSYGKIHPFFMGKSTISMAMFNSFLLVHQRVTGHIWRKRFLRKSWRWTSSPIGWQILFKTFQEDMGNTLWLCQNSYWKWPLIVDLPIKNGDFP